MRAALLALMLTGCAAIPQPCREGSVPHTMRTDAGRWYLCAPEGGDRG